MRRARPRSGLAGSSGGTPVLWNAWSVSIGPLWHVTHWPLPMNRRKPRTSCGVSTSGAAVARDGRCRIAIEARLAVRVAARTPRSPCRDWRTRAVDRVLRGGGHRRPGRTLGMRSVRARVLRQPPSAGHRPKSRLVCVPVVRLRTRRTRDAVAAVLGGVLERARAPATRDCPCARPRTGRGCARAHDRHRAPLAGVDALAERPTVLELPVRRVAARAGDLAVAAEAHVVEEARPSAAAAALAS